MALSVVRTIKLTVSEIQVLFNDDLDANIGVANVSIYPSIDNIPAPQILSVEVENDILTVTYRPIFASAQYQITFLSTSLQQFKTVNGEVIVEDGNRNTFFFTSPGEEESAIRDAILDDLTIVYDKDGPSLIRDVVSSAAYQLEKTKDEIATVKSANYLSVLVEDERMTRGEGPIDKFKNGGVFEVLRVGLAPTGTTKNGELIFNSSRTQSFVSNGTVIVNSVLESLTADPISLQSFDVIDETVSDDIDLDNHFSGLTIKVSKGPVLQLISLTLNRNGTLIPYNVENFGYALKDNRYDTASAFKNANLSEYDIELSTSSITGMVGGFEQPRAGDSMEVSYVYKKLGRNVDPNTVSLFSIESVVREAVPAIINYFTLKNAPIVNSSGEVMTSGGVEFLNTEVVDGNVPYSVTHPAFVREIRFDLTRLPARVGEYCINYETGDVYVFGEDEANDGAGDSPPVASYTYRKNYVADLDYTFNSDTDELAIKSGRSLSGIEAYIEFEYEDVFAPGTDYRVLSHVESLNERVENRLIDDFRIKVRNFPITNVFRILNETTGEIYSTVRFNDTSILFSGRNAPKQKEVTRERAIFDRVPQEILLISDELENSYALKILKINLENSGVTDNQGRFIGANFDTSVVFSRDDIFAREFFYEDRLFTNVDTNIDRLLQIGDYCVDYNNGIIYVAVSGAQGSDIGDISYQYKNIKTINDHILGVHNIYRSYSASQPNVTSYTIGDITDTTAGVIGLEQAGERFIDNNSVRTLVVGTYQNGIDGVTTAGSNIFTSYGAIFTADDIGRTLQVGSSTQTPVEEATITSIVNTHQITVALALTTSKTGRVWTIFDLGEDAAKRITVDHNIVSINNIYLVTQLGTLPAEQLDGYYDVSRDSFSGNEITLGATNPLRVGDAVVVNYNSGNVFVDYRCLHDELVVSYEYGNNCLDWSISGSLTEGKEYFVTYKYGAMRDALLTNFGSLTQIDQLTNFSPNLNREVYRSIVGGALQSFIKGPTIPSIETLVTSFTDVIPNITEMAFGNWVIGRNSLHLKDVETSETPSYDIGKFDNGMIVGSGQNIQVPAVSHIKLSEGTIETWVRPQWPGAANDATLTFNLIMDGYAEPSNVYIGFAGINPESMPFSLSVNDEDLSVFGEPTNIDDATGYFIWFDEQESLWNLRWKQVRDVDHEFSGTVGSTGEFYNVVKPVSEDGYEINEITDIITSTISEIEFEAFVDGYEQELNESMQAIDGLSFASGDLHYIFDMAEYATSNRISLFKDGTGYLNFSVFDNQALLGYDAGMYNISTNIKGWESNSLHHVAVSWRLNSSYENDEMHMFVDGEEVSNLFKYGGNPKASASYDFGDIAEETIITYATRPIVGNTDGQSSAASNLFISQTTDFVSKGILIGDSLHILEDTPDGTGSPNFGLPYTITGVGTNSLTLDRAFTLNLGSISFSVNRITATVNTPVNIQDFKVVTFDADGNEIELNGLDATLPDYSVRRGNDQTHVISINSGVEIGDRVAIVPLGLIMRRCKERIYSYGGVDEIKINAPDPVTLTDVKITSIILPRTLIQTGGGFGLVGTVIGAQLVTLLQSYFSNTSQPSNADRGRKLDVYLSGDNINYDINGNQVIITGETYSGLTQESILFTANGTLTTSEYWKRIDSITISIIPIDASQPAGVIEIKEHSPITVSENVGDFAEVVDFSNGIIQLEIYGSGGAKYLLKPSLYEIDYPTYLKIKISGQPDNFYIGSDYQGNSELDGTIDEFRILDILSEDTRIGEELSAGERSITTDYNELRPFEENDNTLLLLHFDSEIEDASTFIDRFDKGYEVDKSVNDDFGMAIKFAENRPYMVDNAGAIFNKDEGTIEFWVSPLDDTKGDANYHYYIDMSSVVTENLESATSTTVIVVQRIREVESVRLITDVFNTGTNYFSGGSVSNVDSKTIKLGVPLPGQNTAVKVTYVPLQSQGDRVSVFRDPSGFINFYVKASGVDHIISAPAMWDRHTWHRIMIMWKMNSLDNLDRLRLFVDGNERGTIKYGTGLMYGTGVVYGQAEVRPNQNRFIVDNIDLTDIFARIYIGADVFSSQGARALVDNIRFSDTQRLNIIRVTNNDTIDTNYTSNVTFAIPVAEDINTTALYDFDKTQADVTYFATLIGESGIFRFKVDVIDSFDKVIGNTDLENLLVELINVIKPAHTEAIVEFIK